MKVYRVFYFLALFSFSFGVASAQCDITSKMTADGIIMTFTERALLYEFNDLKFYSTIRYDGADYFFRLKVAPANLDYDKKANLVIVLADNKTQELKYFESKENTKDSTLNVEYQISGEQLELLKTINIRTIKIQTGSGEKVFNLIDRPALIKEQLICISEKKN